MGSRKIILYISPFARPNIGGAETSLDKLMGFASRNGYYPVLITYQPLTTRTRGQSHEVGNGFEIFRVAWFGNGWFNKLEKYFPLVFLYLFPGLLIKSLDYYFKHFEEIYCIHAHGLAAGAVGVILKLLKNKRLVLSTHAIYNLKDRRLLSYILKKLLFPCDKLLAVSEVARDELIRIGFPADKVMVHKNWVDTDKWKPLVSKTENGRDFDKDFNLLFVGRLIEKKGIKVLVETAQKMQDFNFHILGTGDLEDYVKKASEKYPNIKYHGILNQENPEEFLRILEIYTKCDYLISPYQYDEGFATVLVESLSCGTPVVVSNRGSPPTFLDNTVAYFLSEKPDVHELEDVLIKLSAKDQVFFDRVKCREYAVERFGTKNGVEVLSTYEQD